MPAWPATQAELLLLAADHADAEQVLTDAITTQPLNDAADPAAVLAWRLPRAAGLGPLPWLHRVPDTLRDHPTWGTYLARRAAHVVDLADAVREHARHGPAPAWLTHQRQPAPALVAAIEVWRAATHVPPDDPRATGDAHPVAAAARYQNRLDEALRQLDTPAVTEWGASIRRHAPTATDPGDIAFLANRLAAASRAGVEITPVWPRAAPRRPYPTTSPPPPCGGGSPPNSAPCPRPSALTPIWTTPSGPPWPSTSAPSPSTPWSPARPGLPSSTPPTWPSAPAGASPTSSPSPTTSTPPSPTPAKACSPRADAPRESAPPRFELRRLMTSTPPLLTSPLQRYHALKSLGRTARRATTVQESSRTTLPGHRRYAPGQYPDHPTRQPPEANRDLCCCRRSRCSLPRVQPTLVQTSPRHWQPFARNAQPSGPTDLPAELRHRCQRQPICVSSGAGRNSE